MIATLPPTDFSAEVYLDSLTRFGIQLGLDRIRALLEVLGQPQQHIPAVHVAGTNGKGSVCALIAHAIAAAGYRVGRYTSPHLVNWRERIWVQGESISVDDWRTTLWQVRQALKDYPPDLDPPTQFEIVTAAAWLHFRQTKVDIAVMEVGLGGRLDSTNAGIAPCVSAIASIGWDHWQRLGNSLEAIAAEKAGIIRSGVPVVSAPQTSTVLDVIAARARELRAPLTVVKPAEAIACDLARWNGRTYPRPFAGAAQLENLAIALQSLELLRDQGWNLPERATQNGLASARWPGRLEWVALCGRQVLLDGAHNVPAAIALRHYLDSLPTINQPTTWLIGMLTTKDAAGLFQALMQDGDRLCTLPINSHVAHSPGELAEIAQRCQRSLKSIRTLSSLDELPRYIRSLPADEGAIVLCGSLYVLGEVKQKFLEGQ